MTTVKAHRLPSQPPKSAAETPGRHGFGRGFTNRLCLHAEVLVLYFLAMPSCGTDKNEAIGETGHKLGSLGNWGRIEIELRERENSLQSAPKNRALASENNVRDPKYTPWNGINLRQKPLNHAEIEIPQSAGQSTGPGRRVITSSLLADRPHASWLVRCAQCPIRASPNLEASVSMEPVRLFIVDNDPGHRELLQSALRRGNPDASVAIAESAEEFRHRVRREPFDCAVLDFSLPDGEAVALLRELRLVQPRCRAIVVSSETEQGIVIESLRNGCDDFLPKTDAISETVLWERVSRLLRQHRRNENERRIMQRRVQKLRRLSEEDPLTGLGNRRQFERLVSRRRRSLFDRRTRVSVCMIDVDHFKRINDQNGHAVGDTVLRAIAHSIKSNAVDAELVWRWGGEEFLMAVPGLGYARALEQAERIRNAVASLDIRGPDWHAPVTISLGVAHVRGSELGHQAVVMADEALYDAKTRGRNRVSTWEMAVFERLVNHSTAQYGISSAPWKPADRAMRQLVSTTYESSPHGASR